MSLHEGDLFVHHPPQASTSSISSSSSSSLLHFNTLNRNPELEFSINQPLASTPTSTLSISNPTTTDTTHSTTDTSTRKRSQSNQGTKKEKKKKKIYPKVNLETNFIPPLPPKCSLCQTKSVDSWDYLKNVWHKTCSDHNHKTDYDKTFQTLCDELDQAAEAKTELIDLRAGFRADLAFARNIYGFTELRDALKPSATSHAAQLSIASRWNFVYKDATPTSYGIKFRYTCSQTSRNDRPRDGKKGRKTAVKRDGGRVAKFPCNGVVTLSFNMRELSATAQVTHKVYHEPYEKTRVVDWDVVRRVKQLMGPEIKEGWIMDQLEADAEREGRVCKTTKYQIRRYMMMKVEEIGINPVQQNDQLANDYDVNSSQERGLRELNGDIDLEKTPQGMSLNQGQTRSAPLQFAPPLVPSKRIRRHPRNTNDFESSQLANQQYIVDRPLSNSGEIEHEHQEGEEEEDEEPIDDLRLVDVEPDLLVSEHAADDSVNAAMSIILGSNHQALSHAAAAAHQQALTQHRHQHSANALGVRADSSSQPQLGPGPTTDEMLQQFQRDSIDAALAAAAAQVARGGDL